MTRVSIAANAFEKTMMKSNIKGPNHVFKILKVNYQRIQSKIHFSNNNLLVLHDPAYTNLCMYEGKKIILTLCMDFLHGISQLCYTIL